MKKVRIKKLPTAQSGLEVKMGTSGRGMIAGLGLNSNTMPWPVMAGQMAQPDIEVNKTLKPVAREGANLEAEKGETAFTDMVGDGIPQMYKIAGKRHYEGGTPLNLPEDSFIFSRDKKMKIGGPILESFGKPKDTKDKFTPAELSAKYDINEYRKMLADPDTDKLQRDTAELMIANYNLKLAKLGLVQESKKGFPDGIPAISMPYIEVMQVDPTQFMMQNPQGQGPQGMSDQPAADNVAKYGMTIAQKGKTVKGPSLNELYKNRDNMHNLIGLALDRGADKAEYAGYADLYNRLDVQIKAKEAKGEKRDDASYYKEKYKGKTNPSPGGWYDAEGERMDIKDPEKGFFHKTAEYMLPSGKSDLRNIDYSKIPTGSYDRKEVPTVNYQRMQKNVEMMNPFDERQQGVLPYLGNLASYPVRGANAAFTGEWENPDNFAVSAALDPLTYLGVNEAKWLGKGLAKVPEYTAKAAGAAADLAKKYGPEVYKVIEKYGLPAVKKLLKSDVTAALLRSAAIKGVQEYATDLDEEPQTAAYIPQGIVQPQAVAPQVPSNKRTIQAPAPVQVQTAPATQLTPEQEYEEYMKANAPKKNFGGTIEKFDGGGSYTISKNNRWITYEDGSVFDRKDNGFIKSANPNWGKSAAPATTKTSAKAPSKTNPMMGTYTPSVMEALKKKEAEGYEIFAPKIKPGEKGHTGKERDVLQHQQKKVHNVYGDVEWSPEQQEDFKTRHGWVYEQKPDFNPTDETVVGTWPKGTKRNGKDVSGQPMTKGQQDTQWFQQEAEKAVPGYFNQGVSGTEFDALMGEHTFSVPGWKKKAAPAPGPAKIDEEEERIKQAVLGPEYKTPGPDWWLQDKVKMAGAFGDLMRIKKYPPWEATPATAYGERTFYDPTRELAANAEMVNQGIQGASTFSGPQGFAATAAALNAQGSATDANTMARYNNMNVEASNQLSDMNADIFNRAAQNRATQATRLFDKQTIANQQFDNSKNMARQNLRQGFIDAITNRANTFNLNTLNPQFAVGPGTGGMVYNIPGSNRGTDSASLAANAKAQQKSAKEFMDSLHGQGYTEKEMELLFNQAFPKAQSRENQQSPQGYT